MAFLLGLLTALGYGAGDFLGGLASRRVSALVVACYSQLLVTAPLLVLALLVAGLPGEAALLWGGGSGVAMALGLLAYYRGLAEGYMGLVAAVTGVLSALVPLAAGLALGERPGWLSLAGIVAIVVAIALVSGGAREASPRDPDAPVRGADGHGHRGPHPLLGVFDGVLAGVAFGLVFVFLDQASEGSALWPVVMAGGVGGLVLLGVMLLHRPERHMARSTLVLVALAGLLQGLATLAFVVAVRIGLLSVIAVAGALSPAPTALLARFFQAERMSRLQLAGFGFALAGIVLIVLGGAG